MRHIQHLSDLATQVGRPLGDSDWVAVEQSRIDRFAEATGDRQWIHVDPLRAADGPFGCTVAHGLLTLSLLPQMMSTAFAIGDARLGINYGLNRVRFPAPVRVDSRLRARFELLAYSPLEGGAQLTLLASVEREGSAKPVCVAEMVVRHFT